MTPRTVAHQAPLSMGFSRQEYWSGLPCPPPGDLPDPGIKPESPALAGKFFTKRATREALDHLLSHKKEKKNSLAATWMDLESVILSEVRQTEKDKYDITSLIYGIYNKWYKGTCLQNRDRVTDVENKLMVTGEAG